MKRFVVLVLIIIFACGMPIQASSYAPMNLEENNLLVDIVPLWTMINKVTNGLDISTNGNASMFSRISTYSEVDNIRISAHLQRYEGGSWITIKHWTQDYTGSSALWTKNWYVNKGYNYRLMTYFHVSKGTSEESTILISGTKYY